MRDSNNNKRIYISRQGLADRGRKVQNYSNLKKVLDKYGIEPHEMETYNFKKQIKLFSKADLILGPHGAG
ncbi:MAG: glycosyltransferase 61 family protein, partial [Halobacteriaceae archaeon]